MPLKIILSLAALCLTVSIGAQELISKIPSDAKVVITIKGKNITQLMSVEEFSNSKLGQMMTKELSKETNEKITSLDGLGLNLEKDFHYFLETEEGVLNSVFLVPLKNKEGLNNLFADQKYLDIKVEGGISYFQDEYDSSTIMWNKNMLVMIMPESLHKVNSYDNYSYYDNDVISIEEVVEEASDTEEVDEAVVDATGDASETVAEDIDGAVEESVVEATEEVVDYYNSPEYLKQQEEREKRRIENDNKRKAKKAELAAKTLLRGKSIYSSNPAKSILKNANYIKSIGVKNKDEATVWAGDVMELYDELMLNSYALFGVAENPYDMMNIGLLYDDLYFSGKLNFEDDRTTFDMSYNMNDELAKVYKPMYNGKFNKNFLNYLNEDKLLGYWNLNISTAGTLNAYPDLLDKLFKKDAANTTVGTSVSLAVDLLSIFLDEEAIATLVRGDMLLAVTDLGQKEVTYTDYIYDENYEYEEVEKTKTEVVPDFLFMFTSDQEKVFNKLMKIGVSEGVILHNNGIYEGVDKSSNPFKFYMMYKDNTVFLGTSKDYLIKIDNNSFVAKLSSEHKANLKKNSTSIYVNGKRIISKIPESELPSGLRKKIGFLTQNVEDLKMNFSRVKGNSMKGNLTWANSKKGHKNSLVYFINMIDSLMK